MTAVTLNTQDFAAWNFADQARLGVLITDALARAAVHAPCILEDAFQFPDAAKAILREAVVRRMEAGSGAVITKQHGTGPFTESETIDNRAAKSTLLPADIADLQRLCVASSGARPQRGGMINLDPSVRRAEQPAVFPDVPYPGFPYNIPGA